MLALESNWYNKMKDKQREGVLIISQVGEEFQDVEKRYKSLKKIIKNLQKFSEVSIKNQSAEA